jgi:hypothetical protein
MGDRLRSLLRVRMSEDKVHTKDSCWSMDMVYDHRGLFGISTTGPGVAGCYKWYSSRRP